MFDFEKLEVYQKARAQNVIILKLIFRSGRFDRYFRDQWKRATLSITLNIAEATGRIAKREKKYFYTVARASAFECVAILDAAKDIGLVDSGLAEELYNNYEQISKMLLALIRSVK